MKLIPKIYSVCGLTAFVCGVAFAQNPPSRPTQADIVRDNLEGRMNNMRNLDSLARKEAALRDRNRIKGAFYRPELTVKLQRRLVVDEELVKQYRGAGGKSGVVKLVEQRVCEQIRSARKLSQCYQDNANIREFANSYSFREKKRSIFGKSDIGLSRGHLVGARHSVQTILVDLGNEGFETVDADSASISYLVSFRPSSTARGMDAQFDDFNNGLIVANYVEGSEGTKLTYTKAVKLRKGAVYALRSIAYRAPEAPLQDKDVDVVVLLKVVDLDSKGTATVAWRELSRAPGRVMKIEETDSTDG